MPPLFAIADDHFFGMVLGQNLKRPGRVKTSLEPRPRCPSTHGQQIFSACPASSRPLSCEFIPESATNRARPRFQSFKSALIAATVSHLCVALGNPASHRASLPGSPPGRLPPGDSRRRSGLTTNLRSCVIFVNGKGRRWRCQNKNHRSTSRSNKWAVREKDALHTAALWACNISMASSISVEKLPGAGGRERTLAQPTIQTPSFDSGSSRVGWWSWRTTPFLYESATPPGPPF